MLAACTVQVEVDPTERYPWVYLPEAEIEEYEAVRWETETWDWNDPEAALYLLKAGLHRPDGPPQSVEHFRAMASAIRPLAEGIRLSFIGDIMWIGEDWDTYALPAADALDGDLRVGNLETPVAESFPTNLDDLDFLTFNAPPSLLEGLPLDVVQLTNNHTWDLGETGLDETLAAVDASGLLRTGVDTQLLVEVDDTAVAFIGATWGHNRRDVASQHAMFEVPFGHLEQDMDLTVLTDEIALAHDNGADSVVLLLHWGFEYEYYPDPHFMVQARRLIAAGADLIVGTGPHVVQPAEICQVNPEQGPPPDVGNCVLYTPDGETRTAAVLYSLGNFGSVQSAPQVAVGLAVTVSLSPDVTGLGWSALTTVDGPQIVPSDEVDDPEIVAEIGRLEDHIGTNWRR